jgi:hypothetical protein
MKTAGSGIPVLISKGGAHVDFLKKHQDSVISNVTVPENARDEALNQYESDMYDNMLGVLIEETKAYEVPAVQEEIQSMNRILIDLEDFKGQITEKEPYYDNETFGEWGGAGVVVTSNENSMGREGDLVVLMDNPHVVAGLMHSLKDVCADYLTYRNKDTFYYGLAKIAAKSLNSNGELSNTTQFFIEGVQYAKKQVEGRKEYLSGLIEKFELFLEKRESDTEDDW